MKPLLLLAALAFPLSLPAQVPTPQLQTVLNQLDAASARFKNARADLKADFYVRVIKDTNHSTGPIYFERSGNSVQMGAVLTEDGASKPKVVEYKGGQVRSFDPGNDQITVIKATGNQSQLESFLTLGFGGSGKDLAKAWDITDQGPETIDNIKTEKLDLVSKDPDLKTKVNHVTIWIDPARGVSLKQIFYMPNGDTRTNTFSGIKLNTTIDGNTFKMHTDSNTKTVTH